MTTSPFVDGARLGMSARAAKAAGIGTLVIAGLVVNLSGAQSAEAATALFVGGLSEPSLPAPLMAVALGGAYTGTDPVSGTPWVRQSVSWPASAAPLGTSTLGDSVSQGVTNLLADIAAAQQSGNGPVTVIGASAGSLVVDDTLRYYQEHPDLAPDPADVRFVVIADGTRQDSFKAGPKTPVSGYLYQAPPLTDYDVTVVGYQYDGFSDFPDRPTNLVASANAVAGIFLLHSRTYLMDISNLTPTSVVTNPQGGTTTRYLLVPNQLPLVTLMPMLKPMEKQLTAMVEAGYKRNDTVPAAATTAATAASPAVSAPATTTPVSQTGITGARTKLKDRVTAVRTALAALKPAGANSAGVATTGTPTSAAALTNSDSGKPAASGMKAKRQAAKAARAAKAAARSADSK